MKRLILAGLGLYFGYIQFRDSLEYWLPAWGSIDGSALGQTAILAVLSAFVFGSVIALGYRALSSVLD